MDHGVLFLKSKNLNYYWWCSVGELLKHQHTIVQNVNDSVFFHDPDMNWDFYSFMLYNILVARILCFACPYKTTKFNLAITGHDLAERYLGKVANRSNSPSLLHIKNSVRKCWMSSLAHFWLTSILHLVLSNCTNQHFHLTSPSPFNYLNKVYFPPLLKCDK